MKQLNVDLMQDYLFLVSFEVGSAIFKIVHLTSIGGRSLESLEGLVGGVFVQAQDGCGLLGDDGREIVSLLHLRPLFYHSGQNFATK